MAFDPETAYAGDWQYLDRVQAVTLEVPTEAGPEPTTTGLKGRWGTINTPDLVSVAAGLGLSSDAAAVVVWEPKPTDISAANWEPVFAPKPGHILRIEATQEGWMIKAAGRTPFQGKWQLLCDREITNA